MLLGIFLSLEPSLFQIQHHKSLLFFPYNSSFSLFLNMLLKGVSSVHVFDHIPICLYVQIPCLVLFEWDCAYCLCFLCISRLLSWYFSENLFLPVISLPLPYFLLDYCLLKLMSLFVFIYQTASHPLLCL